MPRGIARLNTLSRILTTVTTRSEITCTANGNAKISTAQAKFGQSSAIFDGADDFITANLDSNNLVTNFFESGQVGTIEVWLYIVSMPSGSSPNQRSSLFGRYGTGENGWAVDLTTTGNLFLEDDNAGPTKTLSSAFTTGSWQHLAIVNNGSGLTIYRNGTQVATNANIATNDATTNFRIGNRSIAPALNYNGYMDEFRISNIARYTTNFTPSDSPFTNDENTLLLLHFENFNGSTSFIDDGGQSITVSARPAKTITIGGTGKIINTTVKSGFGNTYYNDGANSYLSIAQSSDFAFGSSTNFCIEGWWYFAGSITNKYCFDGRADAKSVAILNDGNTLKVYIDGAYRISSALDAVTTNNWHHIAYSRSGTTGRLFLNGSVVGSWTDNTAYTHNNNLILNGRYVQGQGSQVWCTEFRISNVARYTAAFTPSSTPFVNDTNTLVLLHFDEANNSTTTVDDNS